MKTMYKEEYSRKKLPAVLGIFFFMSIMIFVSDGIKAGIKGNNALISLIANVTLPAAIIIAIAIAANRCRCKFRYSLIASQFVVHRMIGQEQIIEKNIKLEDVISVKEIKLLRFISGRVNKEAYILSVFNRKVFCCTYKDGENVKEFFFQPSQTFICKLRESSACTEKLLVS